MNYIIFFTKLNTPLFSPQITLFCFSCTWQLLEYCLLLNFLHNLFLPLPIQTNLVMLCAWWDLHTTVVLHYGFWVTALHLHDFCGTKLFLPLLLFGNVMSILLQCSLPHNPFILLFTSSPECMIHLYIPQRFTHCWPAIICVVLWFVFNSIGFCMYEILCYCFLHNISFVPVFLLSYFFPICCWSVDMMYVEKKPCSQLLNLTSL